MSPELRARVMASVSGHPRRGARQKRPRLVASLRLGAIALVASVIALVVHVRGERQRQLEDARGTLLATVRQHAAELTAQDRKLPSRVEQAVKLHAAGAYAGDFLPQSLQGDGALGALLALPTVYLRGSLEVLARPGGVLEAASASWTDAFVLCLLDPPAGRDEKTLRAKARAAHARGAVMSATPHVQRLAPVLEVLPLLSRDSQQRIATAESGQLRDYRRLYDVAPVRAALNAVKARQLLLVVDEPGDASTPAELDGERPHAVRVVLSDLTEGTVRLRFRHRVDPSGLSAATRAEYASGVDSCGLALELRRALGLGE